MNHLLVVSGDSKTLSMSPHWRALITHCKDTAVLEVLTQGQSKGNRLALGRRKEEVCCKKVELVGKEKAKCRKRKQATQADGSASNHQVRSEAKKQRGAPDPLQLDGKTILVCYVLGQAICEPMELMDESVQVPKLKKAGVDYKDVRAAVRCVAFVPHSCCSDMALVFCSWKDLESKYQLEFDNTTMAIRPERLSDRGFDILKDNNKRKRKKHVEK